MNILCVGVKKMGPCFFHGAQQQDSRQWALSGTQEVQFVYSL